MRGWLEVELAATDAWAAAGRGPGRGRRGLSRAGRVHGRGGQGARAGHQPRRRRVRRRRRRVDRRARGAGSTTGSPPPTCSTRRSRLQLVEAGLIIAQRRDRVSRRARRQGARARARRCASGAPTASTRSRPRSACGSPASPSRPTATSSRLRDAFEQAAVGKLSGAVGTYASTPPAIEAAVMDELGLRAEDISTQVVPRDRHAQVLEAIALAGAGLERFAQEIRNLQRTEVREVEEPFASGEQKGSSAMPHKRNPITAERVCGLARVLRGYAQAGLENVALWHERDISHSGAERVILPDATILLDYMQHLCAAAGRGPGRARRPDAGEPRAHPRGALQPAGADRADRVGDVPRRGLPAGPGGGAGRLGHRHAVPRAARRARRRTWTSTRCSTTTPTSSTCPALIARLDRIGGGGARRRAERLTDRRRG